MSVKQFTTQLWRLWRRLGLVSCRLQSYPQYPVAPERRVLAQVQVVIVCCSVHFQALAAESSTHSSIECNPEVAIVHATDVQEVNILGNDFPALHGLTESITNCNDKQRITANLTQSYRDLQLPALTANPAKYDVVFTGNNAIVPLLNDGLLQPLDDLIEKYFPQLDKRNRVTFDGQTFAIAFLVNSQHLFVRNDLLNSIDAAIPESFSQMIAVCEQLKKRPDSPYPLLAAFKSGWDLGLEFINHYLAAGGTVAGEVNNDAGRRSLANLKAMSQCMHPDFLSRGINDVQAEWQAGNAAIAFLWGSRASSILDSTDTLPAVKEHTLLAGAPTVGTSETVSTSKAAATLWWVGFAIPKNLPKQRAEAGFLATLKGMMSEHLLANYNDESVWLRKDYLPSTHATGVQQVLAADAPAYPSNATIGLLHQAAGQEISAFLQGKRSASDTLEAIDAWVAASAKEQGLIKD